MDEKLRHILKEKLDSHESAVPGHLWEKVSTHAGGSSMGVLSQAKWFIAAAISAGIIGLAVWLAEEQKTEDTSIRTESTTQPNTSQPVEQPTEKPELGETKTSASASVITETIKASPHTVSANSNPETTVRLQPTSAAETMGQTTTTTETPAAPSVITPAPEASTANAHSVGKDDSFSAVQINRFDLAFFFIPTNPKAEQYRWEFGDGEHSNEMSPQHTYNEPGVYDVRLQATAKDETTTINQTVECFPVSQLHVPTIFTPNGDGKNDLFDILSLSKFIEVKEFRVLDEKGNLVFSSENGEAWNGVTPNGIDAPEGNYLYQIQARDLRQQPVEKSGFIYLRR
jgi:gliding motility-associated-like protein